MITTTNSPTINPVTPPPKTPANAVTAIPQAKASYNSGELLPMIGTPEYKKAQELANASRASAPAPTPTPTPTQVKPQTDSLTQNLNDIQTQSNDVNKSYEEALNKMNTTLDGIRTGTVPLSPYEQAQLDSTKKAMEAVINQQKIDNKNYIGGVTVANEARGLSMYSPEMAQGEIFAATSEANAKVADLNNKMALNLATMETAFRDNDFKKVQESFQYITAAKEEKTKSLENLYKTVVAKQEAVKKQEQESIMNNVNSLLLDDSFSFADKKKAISQLIATGALNTDQIKEINTSLKDANKDIEDIVKIAAENGATPKQLQSILNSANLSEAYNNASGLLSKVETGTIGEYKYYEAQERKAGRVPLSFMDFKNYKPGGGVNTEAEDKLRKEYLDRDEVKAYQRSRGAYDRLNAILPGRTDTDYTSIVGDEAALKGLLRQEAILTDPSASRINADGTVVDSESLSGIVEQKYQKLANDKSTLPTKVKQLVLNADKYYQSSLKGAERVQKEISELAKKRGVEVDLPGVFNPLVGFNGYLYDY